MAYCTADDVLGYLRGVDLSVLGDAAAQNAVVLDAVDAASARVDGFTRRRFTAEAGVRYLDGTGSAVLFIPDLLMLDSWSMDGVVRQVSELVLCPDRSPYMWVRLTSGTFSAGTANVAMSGTWGYGTQVPAEVSRATAMLAAADVLCRIAPARDRGTSSTVQGALSERYESGAYSSAIERLVRQAYRDLVPFRRLFV